jgi:hypothetical protein
MESIEIRIAFHHCFKTDKGLTLVELASGVTKE